MSLKPIPRTVSLWMLLAVMLLATMPISVKAACPSNCANKQYIGHYSCHPYSYCSTGARGAWLWYCPEADKFKVCTYCCWL